MSGMQMNSNAYHKVFPEMVIQMVMIGEESGSLMICYRKLRVFMNNRLMMRLMHYQFD